MFQNEEIKLIQFDTLVSYQINCVMTLARLGPNVGDQNKVKTMLKGNYKGQI